MIKSEQRYTHHTNPPRRKSGVSSVLQRKTLAQAEFSSAEQVQSPKGEAPRRGAESKKRHDLRSCLFCWWTRSDSNRRPPQCECDALPAALLAHSSAYWRNRFIIAQLPPLCNAKNCTNLVVLCPNRIARTAPRAFGERSFLALLAYFSKRFRRYPYPSAFIFA